MKLTERQEKSLDEALKDARDIYGAEEAKRDKVSISYRPQVREGRGWDIDYFYADGDHVVTGFLDVYGNGSHAVGRADWIHSGSEDCDCEPCVEFHAPEQEGNSE